MENSVLRFCADHETALPDAFRDDDVRFPEALAAHFIQAYTKPGDVVFDPFAGYGTTLIAAEKLGRQGYGVEFVQERATYIGTQLAHPERILRGDSLHLGEMDLPPIDLSFTSPPYMTRNDHEEYPFAGYAVTGDGYERYIADIAGIYAQMKLFMKAGAYAMLEICNIEKDGIVTPLAWDVAAAVSKVLKPEREVVLHWESAKQPAYGFGYDHSYCLIFRNL